MMLTCSGKCIRAYTEISESAIVEIIHEFLNGIQAIEKFPDSLQQFFDYVEVRFNIPCEIGLLFVEKILMDKVFQSFILKVDSVNHLINRKIDLYQWVKPKHLEIQSFCFDKAQDFIKKIENSPIPSVKIYYFMSAVKSIYEILGKNTGSDEFFPSLIYCLIKSQLKDLYAHLYYMKLFKRRHGRSCHYKCTHGFKVSISCDCMPTKDWNNEEEYYITNGIAALDFISKLEYYSLKIDASEFDKEITKRMQNLKLQDSDKNSSVVDFNR